MVVQSLRAVGMHVIISSQVSMLQLLCNTSDKVVTGFFLYARLKDLIMVRYGEEKSFVHLVK